jgi:8-oxo-dGTP pyrophosphatase MutT (NUDIX family)
MEVIKGKTDSISYCGAGVLLFSFDPLYGEPYILLCKDTQQQNKWDGFCGMKEPSETPEQTAAREFIEETSGILFVDNQGTFRLNGSFDNSTLDSIESNVKQILTEGKYFAKLEMIENYGSQNLELDKRKFVLFILQIPWMNHIYEFYQQRLSLIKKMQIHKIQQPYIANHHLHYKILQQSYNEKCKIKYWHLNVLKDSCQQRGIFFKHQLRFHILPAIEYIHNSLNITDSNIQ